MQRFVFDVLLYPCGGCATGRCRAQRALAIHTYSSFTGCRRSSMRSPPRSWTFLLRGRAGAAAHDQPVRGSNGAGNPRAGLRLRRAPRLDFHIHASDCGDGAKAASARYTRDEVLHSEEITPQFVAATFDADGGDFVVKPEVRARVSFMQANLLDPGIDRQYGPADVVVVQNVLFHLDPAQARFAFGNVVRFLKERSALLVDGVDLDLKVELTRAAGLAPLDYRYREIYDAGRRHVSLAWWRHYYGAEPRSILQRDPVRRFGSIFLRGA
jgi:hypothetical protein